MSLAGYNVIVSVSTGASATYTSFDGIKSFTIGDSNDVLDITDFADSRLRRRIAGLRDVQISLDGELEDTNAAYTKLRAAYEAGTMVVIQVLLDSSVTAADRDGMAYTMLVESLERSASVDGTVAISTSLQHEGSIDPMIQGTGL